MPSCGGLSASCRPSSSGTGVGVGGWNEIDNGCGFGVAGFDSPSSSSLPGRDGAGQREPLPLPPGKALALLADHGVDVAGQGTHEVGRGDVE